MHKVCDICCGSRAIILSIHQPVTLTRRDETPPKPKETSRRYPCPECCGVPDDMIATFFASSTIDPAYETDQRAIDAIKIDLVHKLARAMLNSDVIAFEQERHRIEATIGVISAKSTLYHEEKAKL